MAGISKLSGVNNPAFLQALYQQTSSGQIDQTAIQALLDASAALESHAHITGFSQPRNFKAGGGQSLAHSPFVHLARQDPRAAMARTNAARQASGLDRKTLETAIKSLFAQLNKDGLALEARPGSKVAEALATGDLSQLQPEELAALLVALVLYRQNQDDPSKTAGMANIPLAPRGSWGPSGNSYGGGTRHTGANTSARAPSGPAPRGPAPGGTPSGQALARSAVSVAHRMGCTGYCFRGVKAAVKEATGVQLTGGSAYMAAGQLANSGRFNEVSVSPSNLKDLPPGAVVVWGKTDKSPHGHISVALGDGREASDHVQTQMTSLRGHQNYRVFIPA